MSAMREAATVCIVRAMAGGIETLLLRRPDKGSFPGAWVFPGGAVDPHDADSAGDVAATRRHAAVREAHEEANLHLEPTSLALLSQWRPPAEAPAQFDTWVFVCAALPGDEVRVDGAEIIEYVWLDPATALEQHSSGKLNLATPTWVTLHHLIRLGATPEEVVGTIEATDPGQFFSRLVRVGDQRAVLWSGDVAYEGEAAFDAPGPRHRISIGELPWRYEHPDTERVPGI